MLKTSLQRRLFPGLQTKANPALGKSNRTMASTRVNEAEADIFGLNAARQPDGWAEAVKTLSDYRKMEPGYWEEILFFDHPSRYRRGLRTFLDLRR